MLRDANMTDLHFVIKRKEEDAGYLEMKDCLVLCGNVDCDRYTIHRDSASADFPAVRLIILLASIFKF